jgi:hypothetical protein
MISLADNKGNNSIKFSRRRRKHMIQDDGGILLVHHTDSLLQHDFIHLIRHSGKVLFENVQISNPFG